MPNLNTVLKSEITRLARKEVRGAIEPLRRANTSYRREIAALKRQIAGLERQLKATARSAPLSEAAHEAPRTTRFAPAGLKALRSRLALTARDFGRLIGASGQSVLNWESGKTIPRESQRAAMAGIRALGKREAARRLVAVP